MKYIVNFEIIRSGTLEIEASTAEEAKRIAEEMYNNSSSLEIDDEYIKITVD